MTRRSRLPSVLRMRISAQSTSLRSTPAAYLETTHRQPAGDLIVAQTVVVFVLSTGETADQLADRSRSTKPAVLYALDAKTGRELYNSGNAMEG